jgi:hypothetical protein
MTPHPPKIHDYSELAHSRAAFAITARAAAIKAKRIRTGRKPAPETGDKAKMDLENVLTYMCGFSATDAKHIHDQARRYINAFRECIDHPEGEAVPEEIIGEALLTAVDEHVSSLPVSERDRLADSVQVLHQAFASPDGLLEVI